MKTSMLVTPKVRKNMVHLIVLLAFLILIGLHFPLASSETPTGRIYAWGRLGVVLLVIMLFYLHSLILLPILLQKRNIKKYVFLVLGSLIVFWIASLWFEALSSTRLGLSRYIDGTILTAHDRFVDNLYSTMRFIPLLMAAFLPFGLISSIYYLLVIDKESRKRLFWFKYLELTVNIIIVTAICLLLFYSLPNDTVRTTIFFYFTLKLLFFYTNTFFITPVLLKEKKTGKYLFLVVFLLVLYILSYKFISYVTHLEIGFLLNTIVLVFSFLIDFVLSFIYGFVRHKFKNQNIKLGNKESELSLLKSQVNPHFLFNTLNTLYSTALEENAPKTAESTAKLASLIRYMQEDINKDFIPLENEIKYLKDYIVIQKLRCAVAPEIDTTFTNIENHKISPGLLIPFVENAFKYGIDPSKKSKLFVSVLCNQNTINFECINSYDENFKTYYKEQGFGIGIKNAKERLGLVYPKKHTFEVKKENNIFSVYISIDTK